ncbi:hypothetical protein [Cupriavidus gilardii]|uniref:hypothetical protein n=1 Tax=Cupriavidus gilardii TaxID=82541 RepID=UPI0012E8D52D|nr:hypothetical protein [Cupriavidus gilardii]
MKAGRWVEVFDLYEWLPAYGENAVLLSNTGHELTVSIDYDGDNGGVYRRELIFEATCFFCQAAMPGPYMLDLDHESKPTPSSLGALVQYPDSEAALVWRQHFGDAREVNHYRIFFLSENLMLEVLAKSAALNEASRLS